MWIHSGMEPAPTAHRDPVTTVAVAMPGLLIAEAFAQVLRDHELHVVGCYETHAALLDCVRRAQPVVAVVDADLLGAAREALAALGEAGQETRLVVIAGTLDTALAQAIARAGVHAVILRSSPTADAVTTIVQVARGQTSLPPSVRAALDGGIPG